MTNGMDGNLPAGTGASQAPASPAQGEQSSPASEPSLADVLRELTEVRSQVRALQGEKDKGIAKVAKRLDTFAEQLAEYKELTSGGLSEKAALKLMQLDEPPVRHDVNPAPAAAVGTGGNQPNSANVDTDTILRAAGIAPNDPEVTQLVREGKTSLTDVMQFIVERSKRASTQPNPAQVLPGTSGQSVPAEPGLEDLTTELTRLLQNPSANIARIRELRAKQAALLPK